MSEPSTAVSTPQISTKALEAFQKEIQELNTKNIQSKQLRMEEQLERLLTQKFQNPYDVLLLNGEATDDEIKKQYRNFTLILHPDKCKDERAKDGFFIVEQAYKTLMDQEKRKVYLRIMREAKERTEYERTKENKRRLKLDLPQLPDDTFDSDYKVTLKKIFDEIEEKKLHMARLEESQQMKKMEELQTRRIQEQARVLNEEEWEKTRDQRVNSWRSFNKLKTSVVGTRFSDKGIRAPQVRVEERPASAPKLDFDQQKPIGINEDYKKKWK